MSDWVVESEVKTKLGHKVLLAGLSEAGKTAVKQLYFNNTKIEELTGLQATLNYERLATTINGVPITILDLGGQRVFIKRFLSGFSPFVFSSVKGLIFLIDVSSKSTRNNSLQYFLECLKKLKHFSPKSQIFIFLHKTDLIKKSPNFNTILQLIMEQFQVETDLKLKFFYTTIFDSETVINSFLRIFELILPNDMGNKELVGQTEHYATMKFTSKNVDVLEGKEKVDDDSTVRIFSKSERGAPNEMKFAGDLNVLKDIQSLMSESTLSSDANIDAKELNIETNKPFEILSKLQFMIKNGMEERLKENSKQDLRLLSLMSQSDNVLASPTDVDEAKKEFLAKKLLSELIKEIKEDPEIKKQVETTIVEEGEDVSKLYGDIDFDKKAQRLMSFYGMKKDDAESVIKMDYENVIYELVAKSNLPVQVVLNALLVNIPFLELSEYDTSVLSNDRILEIFKNVLLGHIKEREVYAVLEKCVQNPSKSLMEVLGITSE